MTEPCSPEPWNHVFYTGIIPFYGRNIGEWIIVICQIDDFPI